MDADIKVILRYTPRVDSERYISVVREYFGRIPIVRISLSEKKIKKNIEILVVEEVPTYRLRIIGDVISITSIPEKGEKILGTYLEMDDKLLVSKEIFIGKLAEKYGKKLFRHEVAHLLVVQPLMSISYLLGPSYGLSPFELYQMILEGIYKVGPGLEYLGVEDPFLKFKGYPLITIAAPFSYVMAEVNTKKIQILNEEILIVMGKKEYVSTEDEALKSLADWWYANIKKRIRRKYK